MVYIFIAAWLAGSSSFGPLIRNGFLDIPTNTLTTVIWCHCNVTIMIHNIRMQNVLVFSAFSCGIWTRWLSAPTFLSTPLNCLRQWVVWFRPIPAFSLIWPSKRLARYFTTSGICTICRSCRTSVLLAWFGVWTSSYRNSAGNCMAESSPGYLWIPIR